MLTTFSLTVFAWIFFRADSVTHALNYIGSIFSKSLFAYPSVFPLVPLGLVAVFIAIEWLGREQPYALAHVGFGLPKPIRWATYYALVLAIFYFAGSEQQFIYFQF